MEKNKKISIITPVYDNGKEYTGLKWLNILNECLIHQVEQDFEWIIIYDGINEQCRERSKNYINIRYYESEERKGNFGNFNRDFALRKSSGNYVVFIDQDNVIFENYLSSLTNILDSNLKIDYVLCPIYCSWQAKNKILYPKIEKKCINTLCFMVRKNVFLIDGWWSRKNGSGDEFFIMDKIKSKGFLGDISSLKIPLGIWNGSRYKYPKNIYPSFIDYSVIEKIAGNSDNATRKEKGLWFSK